jgi:heme/copper-type cytochrome/quinol oxidase subunit 3
VADHAIAEAIHDPNIGNTGLDHRKMGMWIFLGSDCMFFGSLIGTYLSYKGKSISGPLPHEVFDIPLTSYSAALLLASSLFMVLALAALQHDRIKAAAWWLFATAAFGAHFVLTGFHGAHVSGGVIWLMMLVVLALRGKLDSRDYTKVEIAGLYWHFVDIVWIAIFTIVYLIP